MKKFFLALVSIVLAVPLWAQQPAYTLMPSGQDGGQPAIVMADPPAPAAAPKAPAAEAVYSGPSCAGGSCCTHKVCVPEPDKKKIEKVCYSCKCVDFCLPCCPLGHLCHGCKDCNGCEAASCPSCGKVRTKRVLIKHVHVTECDTFKCVPKEEADCVQACPAGGCTALPAYSGAPRIVARSPGNAPAELIPAPMPPAK